VRVDQCVSANENNQKVVFINFPTAKLEQDTAQLAITSAIVGSNPTWGMDVCLLCVFVLSGRDHCDELITRPKDSYRMLRVVFCDQES
jgi:hypothetical protein